MSFVWIDCNADSVNAKKTIWVDWFMKYVDTQLHFLNEDCIAQFGQDKGTEIFLKAENIYESLCQNADYRSCEAIKEHMTKNLYATMAYYKALLQFNYSSDEAITLVKKETAKSALVKKQDQKKIGKLPCAYLLYRLCVKSVMKKNFPIEGWDTKWVQLDGKEIHFDFTRCLYKDICDEEGCPELCQIYCDNDDISFSGLLPKIRFERSGTLGKGNSKCDFHLIKNKN